MLESAGLKVSELSYAFGKRQVLSSVDLHVEPGKVTLLLGPNGAGKTTLFSLIAGLLSPQVGTISLPDAGRAGLAIVFQQPALDLDLTVGQNLSYHGGLYGLSKKETLERTAPFLERLELASRHSDKVRSLNGGHRRRLEIVRALMSNPTLLLLDEPTAGLDAPTRKALVIFLHEMAISRRIAVLWATHLTDEVSPGDDVLLLHRGQVMARGTTEEVIKQSGAATLDAAFLALTQEQAA